MGGQLSSNTVPIYLLTAIVTGVVIIAIIVQRQISRIRNNSARKEPTVNFRDLGRRQRQENLRMQELVNTVRLANVPKLTDCTTLGEHYNAPYLNRMIAIDEVSHEIDAHMERISADLRRDPGETTLKYLLRLRGRFNNARKNSIPLSLVHRITFLYECARFRLQKFDMEHRMELKSALNKFVKMIGDSEQVKKEGPIESRKRREKFGGSDGVRLLMATANAPGEERNRVVPSPFHRRRKSDTNFNV